MKTAEYVSRKVMDRYFDKFTRKLVRMNIRMMETEHLVNRLTLELINLEKRLIYPGGPPDPADLE